VLAFCDGFHFGWRKSILTSVREATAASRNS
jgi:hypothetical protein